MKHRGTSSLRFIKTHFREDRPNREHKYENFAKFISTNKYRNYDDRDAGRLSVDMFDDDVDEEENYRDEE